MGLAQLTSLESGRNCSWGGHEASLDHLLLDFLCSCGGDCRGGAESVDHLNNEVVHRRAVDIAGRGVCDGGEGRDGGSG